MPNTVRKSQGISLLKFSGNPVCGYIFRISRSVSYIKVVGSRSMSLEQKGHMSVTHVTRVNGRGVNWLHFAI